ncbi:MAG TPA: ribosome recycling factor [Candidatus Binatia bacterium]|nr:ribosome recycling factor [Candidatus Binatia bacterium]
MTDQEVLDDLKKEMEKTVGAFRRELSRTRTGRASTALLEGIQAEYYGAKTPLIQLATLSAPEPRLLIIQPFDKAALTAIEKAIQQSDLGLNPISDGKILRIPIPELTAERRKEIVRHLHKVTEDFRVSVRAHRHDALELLKEMLKEKDITEDDSRRAKEKIEAVTKEYLERLDKTLKGKEEEVLSV